MDVIYEMIIFVVLIMILIFLSGWFSGIETSLTHLNSAQIAQMKRKGEKNIECIIKLKKDMDKTLVTVLIGNNVVNILLSSIAALAANYFFHAIGISIVIGIITFLVILFGEIHPKSIAIINSAKIAKKNAKRVFYLKVLLTPLIWLFISLSKIILRITSGERKEVHLLVSDDSIKDLASLGEEEGVIKSIEKDIIHSVFIFGDKKIKDIMVPLKKVFYLNRNYKVGEAKRILSQKGYTRVPVFDKKNKVIGILYTKDILARRRGWIEAMIRKPVFVSAESDVTKIFASMKQSRVHMAIVTDEEGEHIGIVTLEDILEELVGEIEDEYSEIKKRAERENENQGSN